MAIEQYDVAAADGTPIPVWKSGSGTPLLMVHGATANHEAWEPVRPYLEGERTVATVDRRASFGDPFGELNLETEFDDIARVAESLGEQVDLFGHSSGALCAMGAALRMKNLRRLVLYEPPMVAGVEPPPEAAAAFAQMDAQLKAGDAAGLRQTFARSVGGRSLADPDAFEEALEDFEAFALYIPREMAALAACTSLAPEAFAGVQAPTLFLAGADTPAGALRAYIEPLSDVMPSFTVWEIPGQEHMANTLAPEAISRLIDEFLSREAPAEPA